MKPIEFHGELKLFSPKITAKEMKVLGFKFLQYKIEIKHLSKLLYGQEYV